MENFYINHIAVFVCALMSLIIGALWYSPLLFFRAWQNANGFTDDDLKKASPAKTYSITFLLAWLMSYNLAFFLGDKGTTWKWGIAAGLLATIWSAGMFVVVGSFERRSLKYLMVNCGYIVVYFGIIGFVLGIWR